MAVPMSLFDGPSTAGAASKDSQKQAVFSKYKAICVPLLEAARAGPAGRHGREIVHLLERLAELLRSTPADAFSVALANYTFFPLASLLRPAPDGHDRGDRVLETNMRALAALIEKWRAVGMEGRVRQELWTMTILTLGGPLDVKGPTSGTATAKGKGKMVQRTEEAELAMVDTLVALMRSDAARVTKDEMEDDPLGERIDWSSVHETDTSSNSSSNQPRDPPPPVPILFHTLTTILALAAEPTSLLELQLSSLRALRILITEYLAHSSPTSPCSTATSKEGPSPLLATALPGTASTLSRVALSMPSSSRSEYGKAARRQASSVVAAALEALSTLVVQTLGDKVTATLRQEAADQAATAATLEDLVRAQLGNQPLGSSSHDPPPENNDEPPDNPAKPATASTGPVVPTASWLRYTLTSLVTLFAALSPLSTHDSVAVRAALVSLLCAVLAKCSRTLGDHAETLFEGLLALAGDEWDAVRDPARHFLRAALAQPDLEYPNQGLALALVSRIVQRRMAALPHALRKQDEHAIRRGAGIVRSALDLLPGGPPDSAGGRPTAGPLQGVERWSWMLLSALDLERVPAAGRASEGGMAIAWITGSDESPSTSGARAGSTAYAPVRLRGLSETATVQALEALWRALGRASAAAGQAGEVVEQFLGVALGPRRGEAAAPSALWVLEGVLQGMSETKPGQALSKALRPVYKRTVRTVLALMEDLEGASVEEELPQPEAEITGQRQDALIAESDERNRAIRLVEHKKGTTTLPSLDAYKPVTAVSTTRDARASHLLLLSVFSLRLLATTATALSSAFQPYLMQSLYFVLAALSPTTHPFLRAHAQHTLVVLSEATSYASPQNLVLANVDYVINSVSQRLTVSRLEPNAPLVLVEMIRLVGKPIVPMVQDLVDDVFEALDDYHGYEDLTVGLWAVLDALLKVMAEDLPAQAGPVGVSAATKGVPRPDPTEDWLAFEQWFAHRHDAPPHAPTASNSTPTEQEEEEELPEQNPRQPFNSIRNQPSEQAPVDAPAETGPPSDPSFASDTVAPPTRPQRVTAQILHKALFFLSHPSAFLRARVLSLFASAVPLLILPPAVASSPLAESPASASSGAAEPAGTTGGREADLLPVVHRAWPLILLRLAPPPRGEEPHVVLEAVRLVQALAEHTGEYMSRRIAEDVWPRFAALLSPPPPPRTASLSSTVNPTTRTRTPLGRFSTEYRLYVAVLTATRSIARNVPMKEPQIWEAALVLRRFLLIPSHSNGVAGVEAVEPELHALAKEVYEALGRQNPDAVWCVLQGTVSSNGSTDCDEQGGAAAMENEGLPRWLRRGWESVQPSQEVQEILASL